MSISAKDVAELRRRTGAGMMDCKKALVEAQGDMEKAIAFLKEWGIAKAAKKGDRGASEGVMNAIVSHDLKRGALIEVNCETDFVSNTDEYKNFAKEVAKMIFDQKLTSGSSLTPEVNERIASGISQFGENIIISTIKYIESDGILGIYVHTNFKNATIVALSGVTDSTNQKIMTMIKDIAVHISANTVQAVDSSALDPSFVEEKKKEFLKEIMEQGKPEEIAKKILDGKMQKFYKEETLLSQPFLKNEDVTIQELLQNVSKETGTTLSIKSFIKTVIEE